MELWNFRLMALFQLNEYDALEYELNQLGDLNRNSLDYDYYPEFARQGPIVPFEISIISCLVPTLKKDYLESIERLYRLLYSLKHKDKSRQILMNVASVLLKMEDYFLALQVLKSISEDFKGQEKGKEELDSIRARIYLQLGDLQSASNLFDEISATKGKSSRIVLMNQGLLEASKGDWDNALASFSKILEEFPHDWIVLNNLALIELYRGKVSESLQKLDSLLISHPKEMARNPQAIFNLCTVYDLLDQSLERKKKVLGNVISPFAGDDFQIESLKL